jgi:hypothetical protein
VCQYNRILFSYIKNELLIYTTWMNLKALCQVKEAKKCILLDTSICNSRKGKTLVSENRSMVAKGWGMGELSIVGIRGFLGYNGHILDFYCIRNHTDVDICQNSLNCIL